MAIAATRPTVLASLVVLATACKAELSAPATTGAGEGTALSEDASVTTPSDPEPAAGPSEEAIDALMQEPIAGVTFGMSEQEVTRLLGPPKRKGKPSPLGEAIGGFATTWSWPGIEVALSAELKQEPFTVYQVALTAPSTAKTARGIAVGSTRAEVERAYAGLRAAEVGADDSMFVAGSIYGGVHIAFEGDRVTAIFLGSTAE
jgi:hypothetical protein